jgi:hypothetical protein
MPSYLHTMSEDFSVPHPPHIGKRTENSQAICSLKFARVEAICSDSRLLNYIYSIVKISKHHCHNSPPFYPELPLTGDTCQAKAAPAHIRNPSLHHIALPPQRVMSTPQACVALNTPELCNILDAFRI